jgi:hypothetical protein
VVEYLPSKHKALSSNHSTEKKIAKGSFQNMILKGALGMKKEQQNGRNMDKFNTLFLFGFL